MANAKKKLWGIKSFSPLFIWPHTMIIIFQAVSMDLKEQRLYKQLDMPPPLTVPSAPSSSMPPPPPRPRSPTQSTSKTSKTEVTSACNSSTSKTISARTVGDIKPEASGLPTFLY